MSFTIRLGKDRRKAVAIVSGGLDSSVLAYHVVSLGYELTILSFNYGQRHRKELNYAKKIAENLGAVWHEVDLTGLSTLLAGSALTESAIEVPDGHYSQENMAITVVPNRNAIMLSIAYGHAVAIGASFVFTGVHAGDHAIYPDCRPAFIARLDTALAKGNEGFADGLAIVAPFVLRSKADIVFHGAELKVPFEQTWSCYKGGEKHCGRCGTCVERREAFDLAKVPDPTEYEDSTFWKKAVEDYQIGTDVGIDT